MQQHPTGGSRLAQDQQQQWLLARLSGQGTEAVAGKAVHPAQGAAQRLGSFHTAEEAAMAVVSHALGILPTPPTPPARNRRGEGRRPRDRRKKRLAAEAGDVQVRYECAIGAEDEDGVQWYE